MTQTVIKIILLLHIYFLCSTQTVSARNQVPQELNNKYKQNSLEEPRFAARNNSDVKEKSIIKNVHVSNRVLDNFDHRYPDGSYEFRYELADGQARYERGYFINLNNHKSLVVVGYYSYRMPTGQFITVFYNADQYGYRQNQAITRDTLPDLPRSIEIPEARQVPSEHTEVTTKKSKSQQIRQHH